MCRFSYYTNTLIFYHPLYCSTDADELYHAAKHYCDLRNVRLVSIEPCGFVFGLGRRSQTEDTSQDRPKDPLEELFAPGDFT